MIPTNPISRSSSILVNAGEVDNNEDDNDEDDNDEVDNDEVDNDEMVYSSQPNDFDHIGVQFEIGAFEESVDAAIDGFEDSCDEVLMGVKG